MGESAELRRRVEAIDWWHSIELPGYGVTPGREPSPRSRDAYMKIPWERMRGKRVIDIGAWDGLYSFLAEEAGARDIWAVDTGDHEDGIDLAVEARDSKVQVRRAGIESYIGYMEKFDFALFLGVLYHLQNPMRALQNVAGLLEKGGLLVLETALLTDPELSNSRVPYLELCEHARDNDPTNWNYPNRAWVEAALRVAEFTDIHCQGGSGARAAWHAVKK